jgi:uncharacterized protein YbjQ (UPF0145 family)
MKKLKSACVVLAAGLLAAVTPVIAADTEHKLPFAEVLASPDAKQKLDGSVRFYLAGQATPKVLEKKGDSVSNKKTNAFGKEAAATCRWAALSALISLQDKAKQLGANAVVDIVSFYKKDAFSSATEYECHVGNLMTGVAFKGTMARVAP